VEALDVKLRAFNSMFERLQPRQIREAGVTANVQLSLIDRMNGDESPPSERYSQMEAYAYHTHGRIAIDEGTEESAKRAVSYFEKSLRVCEASGCVAGIVTAKSNIAVAKSMYEGGKNNEELLKELQGIYELRIAENGDENEYTIIAGKVYAMNLHKANRGGEAIELLMKLQATSIQVLGPHHSTTKEVESLLKWNRVRLMVLN
jgi:hypothetical protein